MILDSSPAVKSNDYNKYADINSLIMSGHNFRKIQRISKDDTCGSCATMLDTFRFPGYKCVNCKKQFHTTCIQNLVSKILLIRKIYF